MLWRLAILSVFPIVVMMVKWNISRSDVTGDYEVDDAKAKDIGFFKILETIGTIVSVKQSPDFLVSIRSGLLIAMLLVLGWIY